MKKVLMAMAALAVGAALAVQFAPVPYVDRGLTNVLAQAKDYTDAHVPEIDFSPYALKSNQCFRVDAFTNVVWRCVWSNGIEYVYAYSNDTNMLDRAAAPQGADDGAKGVAE